MKHTLGRIVEGVSFVFERLLVEGFIAMKERLDGEFVQLVVNIRNRSLEKLVVVLEFQVGGLFGSLDGFLVRG
jgi:hypothetical protein